eukprot:11202143-Lingulodinium_polyedra.AAC.1
MRTPCARACSARGAARLVSRNPTEGNALSPARPVRRRGPVLQKAMTESKRTSPPQHPDAS